MNTSAQVLLFDQPEAEMNPGQRLAVVWLAYRSAMTSHLTAMTQVRAIEEDLLRKFDRYHSSFEGLSENDLERQLGKTAKQMRDRMSAIASRQFAPDGGTLNIDDDALADAFPVDEYSRSNNLDEFDPVAVWEWLEGRYGGDAGVELARRQLAARLKREFHRALNEEIVVKGGYVVLPVHVWLDSYSTRNELTYSCFTTIQNCLNCLSEVATWSGRGALSTDLANHFSVDMGWRRKVTSREKFGFGEKGTEVVLVTFLSSFEFRLRQDFAETLQLFLATYGVQEE